MKMKKWIAMLSVMSMVAAPLAGCGNTEAGSDRGEIKDAEKTEDTGKTEDAGKTEGVKKITWSTWGSIEENAKFVEFTEDFNKRHAGEIEAEFLPIPSDYASKMITQITGGSAPDVFYFGSGLSPSVIYNGKVEDLKPYLDKSEKLTYDMFTNEHMGTLSEYEGGIYGVCPDDNPMVLYYNADMFRDAGLKTPTEYWENGEWTIDKYVECMETIAGTSTKDSIQKYGAFFDFDWEVVMTYLNYFGADYYSEDSKTCTLDTSEAKKAIGLMKRLIDDEVAIGNLGAKDSNSISGSALFMSQQAATVFSGRWSTPTFKQVTDFEWDIVPFPTKDKGGLYAVTPGYTYVVMNADSKEKDASWTFIEDFVCPEGQIFRLADGGNATASVVGVNEKILSGGVPTSENLWIDLAEVSTWTPLNIAKYPEATQMILDGIKAIMMDQKEVESGLDDITSKVNDYLANPPF